MSFCDRGARVHDPMWAGTGKEEGTEKTIEHDN